jgi:hypothetical protein
VIKNNVLVLADGSVDLGYWCMASGIVVFNLPWYVYKIGEMSLTSSFLCFLYHGNRSAANRSVQVNTNTNIAKHLLLFWLLYTDVVLKNKRRNYLLGNDFSFSGKIKQLQDIFEDTESSCPQSEFFGSC